MRLQIISESWDDYISFLQTRRHEEYVIPKSHVSSLPISADRGFGLPTDIEHYNVPLPYGGAIHIRDCTTEYKVHRDQIDPNRNSLGHLIADAPHDTIGVGAILDELLFREAIREKAGRIACPRCRGNGLDVTEDILRHIAQSKQPAKCSRCEGNGMLQDDSTTTSKAE